MSDGLFEGVNDGVGGSEQTEAGADGGRIVGEGTPEEIAAMPTATGRALKAALQKKTARAAATAR